AMKAVAHQGPKETQVIHVSLSDRQPIALVRARISRGVPVVDMINALPVEPAIAVRNGLFAGTVCVVWIPEEPQVWVAYRVEQPRGFRTGLCGGSAHVFHQEYAVCGACQLARL